MLGICRVRNRPDASVRVDERVLALDDVAVPRLRVRLLVAGERVADAVVVGEVRVLVVGVDGALVKNHGLA